jgi:hypothetical protein
MLRDRFWQNSVNVSGVAACEPKRALIPARHLRAPGFVEVTEKRLCEAARLGLALPTQLSALEDDDVLKIMNAARPYGNNPKMAAPSAHDVGSPDERIPVGVGTRR